MRRKRTTAATLAILLTVLLAAADCDGDNGDGRYGADIPHSDRLNTPTPPGTDTTSATAGTGAPSAGRGQDDAGHAAEPATTG